MVSLLKTIPPSSMLRSCLWRSGVVTQPLLAVHTNTLLPSFSTQYRHSSRSYHNHSSGHNYTRKSIIPLVTFVSCAAVAGLLLSEPQSASNEEKKDKAKDSKHDASPKTKELPAKLLKTLGDLLGDRFVLKAGDREAHGKDYSYHIAPPPDAVAYPYTTEEVVGIVKACVGHRVPIIPYGSGTSLEGHTIAPEGGITIDMRFMNKLITLHEDDMDCVVQPGVLYEQLNDLLSSKKLFFPLDPGPGASIGGMVGTSCSGTNAVRYGTMKDNVLALKVVLPNGEIVKTRSRAKKSSAGYDLTHLFIGAEGTLGIVTEVTLKLRRIPETSAVALATFPQIVDSCKAVINTIERGVSIGRVELLDDVMMKAVNLSSGTNYDEQATLLFEFAGKESEVSQQITEVEKILKDNGCAKFQFAKEVEEREALWLARKVALYSSKALRPDCEIWITDVCVPISRLADIIVATKQDLAKSPLPSPLVSHAGDGNFHLFILFDPKSDKEIAEAHRINDNLVKRAIEYDGTCTGEHGVGLGKRAYLTGELGPEAVELMKTIKVAIDPHNLFNPGKIVDITSSDHE